MTERPRRRRRDLLLLGLLVLALVLLGVTASQWGQRPETPAAADPQPSTLPSGSRPLVGTALPLVARTTSSPALAPGVERPLDVVVENPNDWAVTMTSLDVEITEIRSPRADDSRPCGPDDFSTRAGTLDELELPAGGSVSLSQARVPRRDWPRLGMLDTAVNQDGCQAAQLTLTFTVVGTKR